MTAKKNVPLEIITEEYYEGSFTVGNYKASFEKVVSRLLKTQPPIEYRKLAINALCEAYIKQTGEVPDGAQVQRLANWLLFEDLTNNHPDKVTRVEYPFLNKKQLRLRYERERADERIENKTGTVNPTRARIDWALVNCKNY